MIEDRKAIALPPEQVTALVQTALRARQNGDQRAARTLLRALATRQPNVAQIWLALATVADTRDEQRTALERAVAIEPQNQFAQRALARFAADDSHGSASAPRAPSPAAQSTGTGDSVTVEPTAEAHPTARAAVSNT